MQRSLDPFRFLAGILAVWANQHQQDVIEYLREENRVLRGKLAPVFYSRAGELLPLPPLFEEAVRKTTAAVCCVGCKHTHVGVPPMVVVNHVTEKEQPA